VTTLHPNQINAIVVQNASSENTAQCNT